MSLRGIPYLACIAAACGGRAHHRAVPDAEPPDASVDAAPDAAPDAAVGCGNGRVEPGENCDDGVENSDVAPGACRSNCRFARCGDGVQDPRELCDDGNELDGDVCPRSCGECGDGVFSSGEFCLALPRRYEWECWLKEAAFGDVDGDSDVDIVAGCWDLTLRVILGDGTGQFEESQSFELERRVSAPLLGDIDGDGDLDVAADDVDAEVFWSNDGTGQFEAFDSIPLAATPQGGLMGDMDGDLDSDIVLSIESGLVVLTNDGVGGFSVGPETPLSRSESFAFADVDLDGDSDVVFPEHSGTEIVLLENDGAGGLTERSRVDGGFHPWQIVTDDLSSDGIADIAVVTEDGDLHVLTGDGESGFGDRVLVGTGLHPSDLDTGDVDGDGYRDIVGRTTSSVVLFLGSEDGFDRERYVVYRPDVFIAVETQDVDEDGRDDVLAAPFGGLVYLAWGSPTTHFEAARMIEAGGYSPPAIADLDGDGDLDLASTTDDDDIFLGWNTLGSFDIAELDVGLPVRVVLEGDFDGDADSDLLGVGSSVVVLRNEGGEFEVQTPISVDVESPTSGDVDSDGLWDLVAVEGGDVVVFLAEGEGELSSPGRYPIGDTAHQPLLADFDGDGDLDILASDDSPRVLLLEADGHGDFLPARPVLEGVSTTSARTGDFDVDGLVDLVTSFPEAAVRLGVGGGAFGEATIVSPRTDLGIPFVGDLDLDGDDDFGFGANEGHFFVNCGGLGFDEEAEVHFPMWETAAADLNADGAPDLVGAGAGGPIVIVSRP